MEETKPTRKKTKVIIDRILTIKVTEERMTEIQNKVHAEFKRVTIPLKKQYKLKCGDTIYAKSPSGKTIPLEFLTTDSQPGYGEDQIDIIVHII